MFRDRHDAGRKLAARIAELALRNPIVLALPRGGVPAGFEVATTLNCRLDLIIVRKVGAPGNPELAAAAIVEGNPSEIVLNCQIVEDCGLRDDQLEALIARERPELERRRITYRGKRHPYSVKNKTVILVDDGAATGTTMKAAIHAIRMRAPAEIVVALPVAPPDVVAELSNEADRVICLEQPDLFVALGYHYLQFHQLADDEVLLLMRKATSTGHASG